jgi:hypothetical protein
MALLSGEVARLVAICRVNAHVFFQPKHARFRCPLFGLPLGLERIMFAIVSWQCSCGMHVKAM